MLKNGYVKLARTIFNKLNDDSEKYRVILFILFYMIMMFYGFYKFDIWKDICIGDAKYYWYAGDAFLKNGKFSLLNYFEGWPQFGWNFLTFRGYLVPLITLLIRKVSLNLNIHQYITYLFLSSLIYAFLFSFFVPRLYNVISNNKSKIWQSTLFFIIFFVIWKGYFFYLLLDVYGLFVSLITVYYIIIYLKNNESVKLSMFFKWGIVLAIGMQLRPSSIVLIYLSIGAIIYRAIYRKSYSDIVSKRSRISNAIYAGTILILGIIAIEIPQIIIFIDAGMGVQIFPFDHGNRLALNSSQLNIETIMLYPFTIIDSKGIELVNSIFRDTDPITVENIYSNFKFSSLLDLFSIWVSYPLEMIKNYSYKLFTGMDIRFSNPYPTWKGDVEKVEVMICMLITYTLNFTAISAIFYSIKRSKLSIYELLLFIVLILQTLLQTLLHVEWRYFLPGYFLVYFLAIYYSKNIMDGIISKENIRKLVFLYIMFMILSLAIGSTLSKSLILSS